MQFYSRISALYLGRGALLNGTCRHGSNYCFSQSTASKLVIRASTGARNSVSCKPRLCLDFGSKIEIPASQNNILLRTVQKQFSSTRRCLCDKTTKEVAQTRTQATADESITRVASSATHQHFGARNATNFDKKLLVFFKKYKSVDEVPELVSVHALNSARNKFRVYVNMFLGFLTVLACVFMIYRGHTRAGRGETLSHSNMRRHPEQYQKQLKE